MAQMATGATVSTNHLNKFPPGSGSSLVVSDDGGGPLLNERGVDVGSGLSASMEQLTAISFVGPEKASSAGAGRKEQQQQTSPSKSRSAELLQVHLEKLQSENRLLERKVHEMTSCQEELLLLRDEIVKLKVCLQWPGGGWVSGKLTRLLLSVSVSAAACALNCATAQDHAGISFHFGVCFFVFVLFVPGITRAEQQRAAPAGERERIPPGSAENRRPVAAVRLGKAAAHTQHAAVAQFCAGLDRAAECKCVCASGVENWLPTSF